NVQDSEFERYVEKIYKKEVDPYTIADKIVSRLGKNICSTWISSNLDYSRVAIAVAARPQPMKL
ncbi:MAG: hypothetical protein GQ536_06575, partial [Candidatus Aminicenantes bacterium]|nr:hypothetical protein [Candidatus Aminicenantes bacterium]